MNLYSIYFTRAFFSMQKYVLLYQFRKKKFFKGVQPYFEISLSSFIHKIFINIRYQYKSLVRIWAYKNANEKAHTFSCRSKNKTKKMDKNGYCVNSPLLFPFFFFSGKLTFSWESRHLIDGQVVEKVDIDPC